MEQVGELSGKVVGADWPGLCGCGCVRFSVAPAVLSKSNHVFYIFGNYQKIEIGNKKNLSPRARTENCIKSGPQIEGARIVRATELFGVEKASEQSGEVFGEASRIQF